MKKQTNYKIIYVFLLKKISYMEYILIKDAEDLRFLTIKAIKYLASADVLLTDAGISDKITGYLSANCIVMNINQLHAFLPTIASDLPKMIVRLCGDEWKALQQEEKVIHLFKEIGYKISVVPGVNIVNRVSGENHFPLTIRNRNESFWVCDASLFHPAKKELVKKLHAIAASNITVAIKHGDKKIVTFLSTIFSLYRHEETPVLANDSAGNVISYTLGDLQCGALKNLRYRLLVVNPCIKMLAAAKFRTEEMADTRLATG